MSEFSNLGEDIKNTVQNAVDSMNFDQLNKNISDSVNSALFEIRKSLNINSNGREKFDWKVSSDSNTNQQGYAEYDNNFQQGNQQTYQERESKTQNSGQSHAQYNHTYTSYSGQSNAQSQAEMWERRKQAAIERANQMRRNRARQAEATKNYYQNNMQRSQTTSLATTGYRIPGRYAGPFLKATGYFFGLTCGFAACLTAALGFMLGEDGCFLASAICAGVAVANVPPAAIGKRITSRTKRFRQYVSFIGEKKFCKLDALASHMGYSKKYLVKDIRKMMRVGLFPQAHFDEEGSYLIMDHQTYQQYIEANNEYQRKQQDKVKLEKEQQQQEKEETPEQKELRRVIAEGKSYVSQITAANDAIPDADISEKLSRLEQITLKIFDFVEQHPEQLPELRKFMEYYLPITLKLVNAYKELDAQIVEGQNITSSKNEIGKTLDTINYAFEKLYDSLYESTAMEVSSDISVLEALFAQDGLTKKDFDLK